MEHLDEVVLELKRELKKRQHVDVYTGMFVNGDLIDFDRKFICKDNISVMLPVGFVEMDPFIAKNKYPAENRPELVFTSEDTTINFTFKYTELPISESQLIPAAHQLRMAIQRLNPSNIFYESDAIQREDGSAVWFDYKSYALDDAMYNFIYLVEIDKKLLQGGFNCSFGIYKDWKTVAMQVVESIRDRTKEKDYEGKQDQD